MTAEVADRALLQLEVDGEGLDALDHRYLSCIARNYDGGPVGIETLSAALSEPRDALEEIVEPFLLQQGFIGRTPRGRVLTLRAYKHLGLDGPLPHLHAPDRPVRRPHRRRPRRQNKHRLTAACRPPCHRPKISILCRHTGARPDALSSTWAKPRPRMSSPGLGERKSQGSAE